MWRIEGRGLNETFVQTLEQLHKHGDIVPSRVGTTKELHPATIVINNPKDRILLVPGRKNNLAHSIFETVWVMTGQNDVESLSKYLPRAADYSDDGLVWRAGYGPRLRFWSTIKPVDQILEVYNLLKKDINTRQAVITIFDPARDLGVVSKDIPCNNLVQFLVRHDRLDMMVTVRSNDVVWGYSSINFFEWSFLQEALAEMLQVKVGRYYHVVNSLHIYEEHFTKSELWQREFWHSVEYPIHGYQKYKPLLAQISNDPFVNFNTSLGAIWTTHQYCLSYSWEELQTALENWEKSGNAKVFDYCRVILAYHASKNDRVNLAAWAISGLTPEEDIRMAAISMVDRKHTGFAERYFGDEGLKAVRFN